MPTRLVLVLLLGFSCGRTGLFDEDGVSLGGAPTPNGANNARVCTAPRTPCTRAPRPDTKTLEWHRGTCEAGLFCLPEDAQACDFSKSDCAGHCVFLDFDPYPSGLPKTQVYGSCPACGPCALTCYGVSGWECPNNCASLEQPIGFVDSSARCFVN